MLPRCKMTLWAALIYGSSTGLLGTAEPPEAPKLHLVVPAYNEAARLPERQYLQFVEHHPSTHFTFVDDGSTDGTLRMLHRLAKQMPQQLHVLSLDGNKGKAEATRLGLLSASSSGASVVGFWDGDLATPLEAVDDFSAVLSERNSTQMVFGARVALLGRNIQRKPSRHYMGRVFATLASWVLSLRIYDTQCGAKLFRNTEMFRQVISEPFGSRWIFDVEIIARYISLRQEAVSRAAVRAARPGNAHNIQGQKTIRDAENGVIDNFGAECWSRRACDEAGPPVEDTIYEFPLREWRDIDGSKIKFSDKFAALWGLGKIWSQYFSPWASWPSDAVSPAAKPEDVDKEL